jgi:hypothetical protein
MFDMDQSINYFQNLSAVTAASLQSAWFNLLQYLPKIVGALIILILGWIIASAVGSVVRRVVRLFSVDEMVERAGVNERFMMTGKYKLLSGMLGQLAKWFIILAVLIAAANTLNLPQISVFLNQIALYIPRAIVAVVILVVGILLGDIVKNVLTGAMQASKLPVPRKKMVASVAKYAIIVFSVMAALTQLGIVPHLIQILFGGLVLALALAFGLGGRDEAARLLAGLRQQAGQ